MPEATDYIAGTANETVTLARSVEESLFVQGIQHEARTSNLSINVGIHEPSKDGNRVRNTLIWVDDHGDIIQRYQKLHLFDVNLKGGPSLIESRSVERGTKIVPAFETPVGRVGLAICFDVRFPEIGLSLRRQNSQIIVFPSAFTIPTGRLHWEPLLRARAIETQSYVIAAAQAGIHNEKRASYGHSMIISPLGEILADLGSSGSEPEIATAEIDLLLVEKTRQEIPLVRRT